MDPQSKFKIPMGTPPDVAIRMMEREIQLLWERVEGLDDKTAHVFPEAPEICSCDIAYTGAHRWECPFRRGGC